jgi:hypothetical protein
LGCAACAEDIPDLDELPSSLCQSIGGFRIFILHAKNATQAFCALCHAEDVANFEELSLSIRQSVGGFGIFTLQAKSCHLSFVSNGLH